MIFAYFATFFDDRRSDPLVDDHEFQRVVEIVRTTPNLRRGLLFSPENAVGRYYPNDGQPPHLAIELYFDRIEHLESAVARDGHLQRLAVPETLPSLREADVEQQVMVARQFPVPDATFRTQPGQSPCSYLVHYPGKAADLNEWTDYYVRHHPQVMATFPGIREIEIYTRVDWCGFMPWRRVEYMQRNKIVFDSAEALIAALNSPARAAMTADFQRFPAFEGGNVHYPLKTLEVRLPTTA